MKNILHLNTETNFKKAISIQKMSKKRLKTLSDLRKFMADIMNQYNNDKIEAVKATKLAYMSNIMKGIIYTEQEQDILERLEKIEEKIQ